MNSIGQELDSIRKGLGISQQELSILAGVPIATLQRLLCGKFASIENIIKVAFVMGFEIIVEKKPT